jgi:hypothetical protein
MEASTQGKFTQSLVADVAIARASRENLSICSSMKRPKSYSWMWDGKFTKVDKAKLKSLEAIAKQELKRDKVRKRLYFNTCNLGKRFPTENKMIKSEKLCFY